MMRRTDQHPRSRTSAEREARAERLYNEITRLIIAANFPRNLARLDLEADAIVDTIGRQNYVTETQVEALATILTKIQRRLNS